MSIGENEDFGTAQRLAERLVLRDSYQDYWTNVIVWIALAEALFPFLFFVVASIASLVGTALGDDSPLALAEFVGISILTLSVGYSVGLCIFLILSCLASLLIVALCRTLGVEYRNIQLGACVGGVVGLVVASPIVPGYIALPLATILGQIGGAYGAWRTYYRVPGPYGAAPRVRFGIKQLLVVTAWCALLMTFLKLAGMTDRGHFMRLGTWLVLQFTGVGLAHWYETSAQRKLASRST